MSIIKSKLELEATIQTLFPDNNSGAITAAKLREYLLENLDSTTLQRVEPVPLIAASEALADSDIDENKRFYAAAPTAQTIDLPELTLAVERLSITIASVSGNGVTFTSTSPVIGDASESAVGVYTILATIDGWLIAFTPLERTDKRSITFALGNDNELADGDYLSIAGVPMSTADTGIVAPFDLTIVRYSLARSDVSASSLKYFIDGALTNTEATSTLRSTGSMLVAWPEGSLLRVQNEGSNIFNPILSIIAEY